MNTERASPSGLGPFRLELRQTQWQKLPPSGGPSRNTIVRDDNSWQEETLLQLTTWSTYLRKALVKAFKDCSVLENNEYINCKSSTCQFEGSSADRVQAMLPSPYVFVSHHLGKARGRCE